MQINVNFIWAVRNKISCILDSRTMDGIRQSVVSLTYSNNFLSSITLRLNECLLNFKRSTTHDPNICAVISLAISSSVIH
jgi:hypothetical protein